MLLGDEFIVFMVAYLKDLGIYCKFTQGTKTMQMEPLDAQSKYITPPTKSNYKNININYLMANDNIYIIDLPRSKYNIIEAYFYSLKSVLELYKGELLYISDKSYYNYRLKISIEQNSHFYKWCLEKYTDIFKDSLYFKYAVDPIQHPQNPDIYLCINIKNIAALYNNCCKYIEPMPGLVLH
jgi:hypothetical protein